MPLYVAGVLFALLAPAFFAMANVLDSYLSNNIFKRLTPLIFFSSLCYVVLLPAVWWFEAPQWLPMHLWWVMLLIAVVDIIYQYPYYWALRETDTSIVASLFSLGKIFIPVFAWFVVGEQLTTWQYIGFFAIIFAGVLLSHDSKKIELNRAFFYMLGVSIMLAVETVAFKYAFEQGGSWSSVFSSAMVVEFGIMCGTMVIARNRRGLYLMFKNFRTVGLALVAMEGFSFLGSMAGLFALSLIPATVASGIGSLQALMVLVYAEVFKSRRRAKYFHESLRYAGVRKKVTLFICILAASFLVVAG